MKSAVVFVLAGAATLLAQTKPNIVLLYIDDLGWTDVGFIEERYYSPHYYETPNIDALAASGMIFNQAYANAPNCAPSRAAMMSGQYAPRTGIYTVGSSARGQSKERKLIPTPNETVLSTDFVTMAEVLKTAGYTTAHMGKWHLGEGAETGPQGQGFDVNIGGYATGSPPDGHFCPWNSKAVGLEVCEDGEYLTDRLGREAVAFIEANKDEPFFLYLAHYAVHTPIQAIDSIIQKYQAKDPSDGHNNPTYAAMIESMDNSVGLVMNKLEELGLTGSTVVVFYADNGGVWSITDNAPLRGGKGMMHEGGIREPFIFKWPGVTQAGSISEVPIIGTDLYPTFMEIAGADKPADYLLDGESIVPLLNNSGQLNRKAIFWHFPAYLQSYVAGDGTGGDRTGWRTTPAGAVRIGDYKLIEYFEYGQLELYNIVEDMGETNNLALEMPGKVFELREIMYAWRDSVNAPVPTEQNPDYNPTPSSVPQDYVTWEEVEPLLVFGCMDSAYEEYSSQANAHTPDSCKILHVYWPRKPFFLAELKKHPPELYIQSSGSHRISVQNIQGKLVYYKNGKGRALYSLHTKMKQGVFLIKAASAGIEKTWKIILW
jgi:arylsulfatase A-like enzyme